ncbi:helix-turn-helix domain-containing protein [Mesorhizobium sp. RIZ17]|uniref:helix-turn-helix domain-containing protein n=1 Tax=Mesorhizobium sp. RIZ17 TaxID=3132743 RepID=UPI003DA98797
MKHEAIRPMPRVPFYRFSSFNRKGGKTHPQVVRTRNRILDLWEGMASYSTIAEQLDISISTVVECIARAKRLKDPRADRPFRHRKIQIAEKRRREIKRLLDDGYRPREIAKRLGVSKRLVLIRMKESGNG